MNQNGKRRKMNILNGNISVVGMGNVGQATVDRLFYDRIGRTVICLGRPGGDKKRVKSRVNEVIDAHLNEMGPNLIPSVTPDDIKNSEIVVITAGFPRKPNESRDYLARKNVKIVTDWCLEIKKRAPECILIIATNPVGAMTGVALEITGFPRKRVLGIGTSLDAGRVVREISKELGLTGAHIMGYTLGNHGKVGMIIPLKLFTVGPIPLKAHLKAAGQTDKWSALEKIAEKMKEASQYLIEGLNRSPWLGPGAHIAKLCEHIYFGPEDPTKGTMFTALVQLNGEYDIKGVVGVPIVVGRKGLIKVIELPLDKKHMKQLKKAAEYIENVKKISLGQI